MQLPSTVLFSAPPPRPAEPYAIQIGAQGNNIFFYWVVAHFPVGDVVSAPALARNAANVLTPTDACLISWPPALGATSFDVLRTSSPFFPQEAGDFAVATGIPAVLATGAAVGLPIVDDGSPLEFYDSTGLNYGAPVAGNINLNNANYSSPTFEFSLATRVQVLIFPDGTTQSTAGGGGGGGTTFVPGLGIYFTTINPGPPPTIAINSNVYSWQQAVNANGNNLTGVNSLSLNRITAPGDLIIDLLPSNGNLYIESDAIIGAGQPIQNFASIDVGSITSPSTELTILAPLGLADNPITDVLSITYSDGTTQTTASGAFPGIPAVQTPWLQNINGGGFGLSNASSVVTPIVGTAQINGMAPDFSVTFISAAVTFAVGGGNVFFGGNWIVQVGLNLQFSSNARISSNFGGTLSIENFSSITAVGSSVTLGANATYASAATNQIFLNVPATGLIAFGLSTTSQLQVLNASANDSTLRCYTGHIILDASYNPGSSVIVRSNTNYLVCGNLQLGGNVTTATPGILRNNDQGHGNANTWPQYPDLATAQGAQQPGTLWMIDDGTNRMYST